jgi:hypothetical protein
MGKSRPNPPPAPNPDELINAQADANRITQFTPQGNLLFGYVDPNTGAFVQGTRPDDGSDYQSAAFTQETPFQTQMRAATEGTGLGLGNLAFGRVTGRTVIGQNPDGSPIFQDDPDFQNPFRTAPTLSGITSAQDIDPTQLANLQNFNQTIATDINQPTGLSAANLTNLGTNFNLNTLPGVTQTEAISPSELQTSVSRSNLPNISQTNVISPSDFATSVSTANLPTLPSDFEATRSSVASSIFDRQLGLLQPEFTRQRQELESNLINRGIPITSDPYNQAVNRLETQQNEALQRLAQQADVGGGAEAQRLFNQASQARGQQFGERQTDVNLANQALQNRFAQQQSEAQRRFAESSGSRGQQFGERQTDVNLANQAALQNFAQQQAEAQRRFGETSAVRGQTLGERQRQLELQNQARGQEFGERAAAGEFGLAAQQQQFGQQAANVQLQNAARQQQIADQLLSNQIAQQQRRREIAERNALRGQNFNELAALLGGPQIQQASFFAPGSIDTQGAFAAQQAAQQNAFNQANAARQANLGGLFGLAGNLGSAYLLS